MLTLFGVGVSILVWVLGRPFFTKDSTHVSFFFELNGCHLLAEKTNLFNLTITEYEKFIYAWNNCISIMQLFKRR